MPGREIPRQKGFLGRWTKGRKVWLEVPAHADMINVEEAIEELAKG